MYGELSFLSRVFDTIVSYTLQPLAPATRRHTTLKSMSLKDTAEMIGITAIVASLIFVGLELRQSHQIALAAQYQARTDSGREYFYQSLASDHRIKELARDIRQWEWPPGFLSSTEREWLDIKSPELLAEASYWATINLYGFDNYHYQYQSGLLSEEGWRAMESRLRGLLNGDPVARYLIMFYGDDFRASFTELAKSLISTERME